MLYTIEQNVPRYGFGTLLLSNGEDLKKALFESNWGETVIALKNGVTATVVPQSDQSHKKGAVNSYLITVGGKTRRVKYLRDVQKYLNEQLAVLDLKNESPDERRRLLRRDLLGRFKTGGWKPIDILMPCGVPCVISPVEAQSADSRTVRHYHVTSQFHDFTAESLNDLTAALLDCGVA